MYKNIKSCVASFKFANSLENDVNKSHAQWHGKEKATFSIKDGRESIQLDGAGFIQLPENLLENVNDNTGFTFTTWVYLRNGENVWERIFDFGSKEGEPSVFLTRNFRGVLSGFGDLIADASKHYQEGRWIHVAYVMEPTYEATSSNAGGKIYIDGKLSGDGMINQTTSGLFGQLRRWTASLEEKKFFNKLYLGHSQYQADPDFKGNFSEVMLFESALSDEEIVQIMSTSLDDEAIIDIAMNRECTLDTTTITKSIDLPQSYFESLVDVTWSSSNEKVLSNTGELNLKNEVEVVDLQAKLSRNNTTKEKTFKLTLVPESIPPYEIKVHKNETADVSEAFYGLFYEDINNAADGGIYNEMIRNRSFESFEFENFQANDNVCGCETDRIADPLQAWYGTMDLLEVKKSGGLQEFLNLKEGVNQHYLELKNGAQLINKGFNDSTNQCAMHLSNNEIYELSFFARALEDSDLTVYFSDENLKPLSEKMKIKITNKDWTHYQSIKLTSKHDGFAQIVFELKGNIHVDVISMFPQNVWGNEKENISPTAHKNYLSNPNYRMRPDLIKALWDLNPKFLRFPGGCISEGAYLWDNVFDWKDTVGPIEVRQENYNLWGYSMTMGLGYFEYFQLAEDLDAFPMPVMACGVLCQARSDYAAPAGGSLRDYYIKSFTDLIDFAISVDYENNEWARLRKEMGHEEPFKLHYLGVGNENWGDEFFANFEIFKYKIDRYMEVHYPEHILHIISTVGAQADDDAFQEGWKFLHGQHRGVDNLEFTDGKTRFNEDIEWFKHADHYMDTIADEHYYRTNDYLTKNADRYNYYKRSYLEDGSIDPKTSSKVFVGEYASTDKNTLAGALAEAAVMTGFERNADVVLLAAYAPLFNKVLHDATYRWTPDLIWFDNEAVWFTPNYYNQKMFSQNIGSKVLETSFKKFEEGKKQLSLPKGKIKLSTTNSKYIIENLMIKSNKTNQILFEQDFTKQLDSLITLIDEDKVKQTPEGLLVDSYEKENGFLIDQDFSDYEIKVKAQLLEGNDAFILAMGVSDTTSYNAHEFVVNLNGDMSGIRVFKDDVEAYRLGDFSTSVFAGNMRTNFSDGVNKDKPLEVVANFGRKTLHTYYLNGAKKLAEQNVKLEVYTKEIFHSVTKDKEYLYIKLVNIDNVDKKISLDLSDFDFDTKINMTTLKGDPDLVDVENVNKKNNELVVPIDITLEVENNSPILDIPAYSSNVLKVKI